MLVLILADRESLALAKALQPSEISKQLGTDRGGKSPLVIAVALGGGGGVVLAGEPLKTLSSIHWPASLGKVTGHEEEEVLHALHEAMHVWADPTPKIRVLSYANRAKFPELFRDLERINGLQVTTPDEVNDLARARREAASVLHAKAGKAAGSVGRAYVGATPSPAQKSAKDPHRLPSTILPPTSSRPAPSRPTGVVRPPSHVPHGTLSFMERRALHRIATRTAFSRFFKRLIFCLPLWLFTPALASFGTLAIPTLKGAVFVGSETGATADSGPMTLYLNLGFALGIFLLMTLLFELVFGPPKESIGLALMLSGVFVGTVYFVSTLFTGSTGMGTWYVAPLLACLGLAIAVLFSGLRGRIRRGLIRNAPAARSWIG